MALPIAIIKMPRLALGGIESWLRQRKIQYSFECESRLVRGCLIAFGGKGFIFCDGSDPIDEVELTLAHETGHFLVDYLLPRQKAIKKFGKDILEAFDGFRDPTVTERVHAVAEKTSIGTMSNLMDRQEASITTWVVEDKADKIGLGLLAQPEDVLKGVDFSESLYAQRVELLVKKLIKDFGLPMVAAKAYANSLLRHIGKGPSWVESLKRIG